jgi:hypothetical protein
LVRATIDGVDDSMAALAPTSLTSFRISHRDSDTECLLWLDIHRERRGAWTQKSVSTTHTTSDHDENDPMMLLLTMMMVMITMMVVVVMCDG